MWPFKTQPKGIPVDESSKPGVWRIKQLIEQSLPTPPVNAPTDGKLVQLLNLGHSTRAAIGYLKGTDLDKLEEVEQTRRDGISSAFRTAQLPHALIAFHAGAVRHKLLAPTSFKELDETGKAISGSWYECAIPGTRYVLGSNLNALPADNQALTLRLTRLLVPGSGFIEVPVVSFSATNTSLPDGSGFANLHYNKDSFAKALNNGLADKLESTVKKLDLQKRREDMAFRFGQQ